MPTTHHTSPHAPRQSVALQTFCVNPVGENTYLLSADGEALLIDCGCFSPQEWQRVRQGLDATGCHLKALLQTHLHFDHVLGTAYALRDFPDTPLLASPDDQPLLDAMEAQIALFLGRGAVEQFDLSFTQRPITPLHDGDTITLGNNTIHVLATPGHSPGGLCFHLPDEGRLFAGDTLFQGSIGRTDLSGGSYPTLLQSLHRLAALPTQTIVHPGHGPSTTIADELRYNPYLHRGASLR